MGHPGIGSATCSRRLPDSRRGWGRAAWVGLVVLGLAFARVGWAQRSYDDLDDAVRDLTRTLVERGELHALLSAADLAGKRVLVKSADFFETETGFRLPLSKVLSRKCATQLNRSRVPVALEGSDEDAVRVLHGRWKRVPGGRLDLTLFVAEPVQGRDEPVALVSVEGRVPTAGIKSEDIEPTLEHWGRYLVRRLDRGVRDQGRRTVRIQPLSIRGEGVARPDELGRVLEGWLAEALLESRWFEFVEPALSESAATVQVDGELLGSGTVSDEHVEVSVRVLDNHRRRVTVASVELSNAFFDEDLFGATVTPPPPDETTALLAECAAHFGASRLTNPRGRNAVECYEQVLKLERGNREALAGLERVEERYVESAREAILRGEFAEARGHVERLRELSPEHARVAVLEGEIAMAERKAEAEARRKREEEARRRAETAPQPACAVAEKGAKCWKELDNKPGCYVWDSYFHLNEPGGSWSGGCIGGKGSGKGELEWRYRGDGRWKTSSGKGELLDGKRNGPWLIRSAEWIFEGSYVDDVKQGHWTETSIDDGYVQQGRYVDGEKSGRWTEKDRNGWVHEGPYVEGEAHGRWRSRSPEGRCWVTHYSRGVEGETEKGYRC